jgi:hypothetical protein
MYMGGLGFRDIELFNLRVQRYRTVQFGSTSTSGLEDSTQEPESLSARVLKSVYFPYDSFLDATVGSSPSRVWRAIMDGKDVLTQGIIRRIGSGATTNIWNRNWLPRKGIMKPLCCTSDHPPARVSELIDHTTGTWRRDQLEEHFILSHPDLRANPSARIHVRQDQVTHMHRLSEYQNTV